MSFFQQLWHTLTQVHPLHPMLVHFPIALSGTAAFFIFLAWLRNNADFEKTAFSNLALAAVSTVVAGASGMRDNLSTYDGQAPNAQTKIALATAMFFITTITSIIRWRNPDLFQRSSRIWYMLAIFVSFGISLVLAYLGGVILYGV